MKISYADYIKKTDVSVLVAEVIFSELEIKYPIKFISEVADTASGGTPSRSNVEYYNGDIPWLKSGELNDGIIENAEEYITKKGLANSSAKLHPKNTLLLAMYGATAGRTGIAKMEVSTNQAVCALFPNENVTLEYLFWFLRQHRYKFIEISKGGAQPNISQSVINETRIPVPDIALQKQISDTLIKIENEGLLDISIIPKTFREKVNKVFTSKNNVFEIDIELNNQLSLVKKLRQQLLQDAVQGKLVEQDPNDEPVNVLLKKIKVAKEQQIDIPNNWVWSKLGNIAKIVRGGSPRPAGDKRFYEGHIPFLKVGDLTGYEDKYCRNYTFTIKDTGLSKTRFVEANTLMLTNSGATLGIPRICAFPTTFNDGIAAFLNLTYVDMDFLYYFLKSKSVWFLNQASRGQGQPNLNTDIIAETLIAIPPLKEQCRIVQKIEQLLQTCTDLEISIKQSASQNDKLLQQVLREALQSKTNVV